MWKRFSQWENTTEAVSLLDLKAYCKAIITDAVWHSQKNKKIKKIEVGKRIGSPQVDPSIY